MAKGARVVVGITPGDLRLSTMNEKTERLVYWNGEFIPEKEARISIYDSALMFGDMIFEMTRSFNQKQFKMREHLERLYQSMKYIRLDIDMTIDEMESAVEATIEANRQHFAPDDEIRVMIDISRGLLSIYERKINLPPGPNVIIAVFPLRWTVVGMGKLFDEGINAVVPSQRAIPASLMEPKVKNRSRLFYLLANIEVSNYAGDNNWALLLDPDGFVAEGTGDNFFIVKDGKIISPEGRNILRGISRDYVMNDLAPQMDIEVIEKNIDLYDVVNADEAFMTGTPFCLLPVTSINSIAIGDGKPGKLTKSFIAQWGKNVGIDIKGQIVRWNKEMGDLKSDSPSPYSFGSKPKK